MHSAFFVGFDIGKIIGRLQYFAISLIISSLNNPPMPVRPSNIVGFTSLINESKSVLSGMSFLTQGFWKKYCMEREMKKLILNMRVLMV